MKNKILLLLLFILHSFSLIRPEAHWAQEKPMVIVIPSYNNSKWCDWNLSSVFQQKYKNYRVVYIDDCSDDNTYDLVIAAIEKADAVQPGLAQRVQVIRNNKNQGVLANLYTAGHAAQDHEIIVTLDGDDALAHENVLSTINCAYQDPNVWLTYGQHIRYPGGTLGICRAIPDHIITNNAYRSYDWVTSHVRTYYAWLFKCINKEDLLYENDFYQATGDIAIMFPLLEMAGGRFKFIDQVLYIYNQTNPLSDFRIRPTQQLYCEQLIRKALCYQPLLPIITPGEKLSLTELQSKEIIQIF